MSEGENPNEPTDKESKWWKIWREWSLADVVIIFFVGLLGVAIPTTVLDEIKAWKEEIPGQVVTMNFVHSVTNETYSSTAFLKDPAYDRPNAGETITSNALFFLSAVLPTIYVGLFLVLMPYWPIKESEAFKKFRRQWRWYEFITFFYSFAIAMTINYWGNKSLKILVSVPIPDFYERCGIDYSDVHNVQCLQADEGEVFKSFKSFPSGHSSNLFTMATLLVLYTWNKLNLFDTLKWNKCGHTWYYRSFIDALLLWPIFLAAWGATTRVTDHVHTPTDILGGACLGYVAARIGYYSQYKHGSPWSYRLLIWPQIQYVIEQHKTLKRNIYPQLFQATTNQLLEDMTTYRCEQRSQSRRGSGATQNDNDTDTELAALT